MSTLDDWLIAVAYQRTVAVQIDAASLENGAYVAHLVDHAHWVVLDECWRALSDSLRAELRNLGEWTASWSIVEQALRSFNHRRIQANTFQRIEATRADAALAWPAIAHLFNARDPS